MKPAMLWNLRPLGRGHVFLLAVLAAVYLALCVRQAEDMGQFLLDGGDAPGIVASDDILDLPGQRQLLLFHDLPVLDDIDGDIVVDKGQHVQIQHVDVAFHFQDVLFVHFVASGVLDDGYGAVQLVQLEMLVDFQAPSGLDVVQHEALFDFSYIQHIFLSFCRASGI